MRASASRSAAPGPLAAAFTAAGFAGVETRAIEVPTVFEDFDDLWAPFLRGTGAGPDLRRDAAPAGA